MQLFGPFRISSRLLPAVEIAGTWISLERVRVDREGRVVYRWYVDLAGGGEFSAADLRSGCGNDRGFQPMFATLLSFLGACAESVAYGQRRGSQPGENADLFPPEVAEWSCQHSDEISMLACEIEETPSLIIV